MRTRVSIPDSLSARRSRLAVLLVLATAVVVRGQYLWSYAHSPFSGLLIADQRFYWNWAVRISQGDWAGRGVSVQGPLYAYLVGALFSVTGPRELPLLCLQLMTGVVTCLLIYDSARRLFDGTTALIAGLIAAVYGPFVFYECMVMKTFLSPFLTAVALWASLRYCNGRKRRWMLLAGASIGIACLVRENHVLLLLPVMWWCWWVNAQEATSRAGRLRHIGLLLGAWAAMILPCTIRNACLGGEFVAVTAGGGEVLYIAHGPYAMGYYNAPPFIRSDTRFEHVDFRIEAMRRTGRVLSAGEASRYWFREAAGHMLADPVRALRLSGVKLAILLNGFEVPDSADFQLAQRRLPLLGWLPSFALLCGLGLLGIIASWKRPECRLPLGMLLCHALTVVLLYNFGRFRLGMLPLWILFAAWAVVWLGREAFRQRIEFTPRVLAAAAFALGLSVLAWLPPVGFGKTDYADQSQEQAAALDRRAKQLQHLGAIRKAARLEENGSNGRQNRTAARLRLARALQEVGNEDEAERVYRQILDIDPNLSAVRYEWAALVARRGRYEEAIEQLRWVIRENPRNIDARIQLAGALRDRSPESLDEVADELIAARNIAPDDLRPSLQLAVIRFQQGHSDEADRLLTDVLRKHPKHPVALRLRRNFDELGN